MREGMLTPWGKADSQTKIAEGIYWTGTPSHGGLMIGKAKAAELLSPEAITCGESFGAWLAYEEDCQYAVVFYEQPWIYQSLEAQQAQEMRRDACCAYVWGSREAYEENLRKHTANALREEGEIRAEYEPIVKRWNPRYFSRELCQEVSNSDPQFYQSTWGRCIPGRCEEYEVCKEHLVGA